MSKKKDHKKKTSGLEARYQKLQEKFKLVEFTKKKRGTQIGQMYCVIRRLLNDNPNTIRIDSLEHFQELIRKIESKDIPYLDEEMSFGCVACHEKFEDDSRPVALSCGHTFCISCCNKLAEEAVHDKVHCHFCEKEIVAIFPLC